MLLWHSFTEINDTCIKLVLKEEREDMKKDVNGWIKCKYCLKRIRMLISECIIYDCSYT